MTTLYVTATLMLLFVGGMLAATTNMKRKP